MQMINTLLPLLAVLAAVHTAMCYNHGLSFSSVSYSTIFHNAARKNTVKNVKETQERTFFGKGSAEHSSKQTALYSLGDPDTNGESNFYRW